jgi:hypothetical protein
MDKTIQSILSIFTPASTQTYTRPQATSTPTYNVRGMQLTDQDLQTARNVLFGEISNRTPDKQQLEARTILNTALNRISQYKANGKNLSLQQVLSAPNQYQAYGGSEYNRLASGQATTTDQPKLDSIDAVLSELKTGQFPDTTGGRVYYKHDPTGRIWLKDGTLFKQASSTQPISARNFNNLTSVQ